MAFTFKVRFVQVANLYIEQWMQKYSICFLHKAFRTLSIPLLNDQKWTDQFAKWTTQSM